MLDCEGGGADCSLGDDAFLLDCESDRIGCGFSATGGGISLLDCEGVEVDSVFCGSAGLLDFENDGVDRSFGATAGGCGVPVLVCDGG